MDTKKMVNIILETMSNPVIQEMNLRRMTNEIEETLERQREEFEKFAAENAALRKKHAEANARIAANNAESKRMLDELEGLISKI